jgi:hypothetical protein
VAFAGCSSASNVSYRRRRYGPRGNLMGGKPEPFGSVFVINSRF